MPGRTGVGDLATPADQDDRARHLFALDRAVDRGIDPLEPFGVEPE